MPGHHLLHVCVPPFFELQTVVVTSDRWMLKNNQLGPMTDETQAASQSPQPGGSLKMSQRNTARRIGIIFLIDLAIEPHRCIFANIKTYTHAFENFKVSRLMLFAAFSVQIWEFLQQSLQTRSEQKIRQSRLVLHGICVRNESRERLAGWLAGWLAGMTLETYKQNKTFFFRTWPWEQVTWHWMRFSSTNCHHMETTTTTADYWFMLESISDHWTGIE